MSKTIEKNCERRFGCPYEQALLLNGGARLDTYGSMAYAYIAQKGHAGRRGITWQFTFPAWAAVWQDSGKWSQRGRKAGCFVMARNGDVGPYAASNVCIALAEVNNSDAIRRALIDRSASGNKRRGTGKGWALDGRRAKPFIVRCGDLYVGSFATQQEAEAAYAAAV